MLFILVLCLSFLIETQKSFFFSISYVIYCFSVEIKNKFSISKQRKTINYKRNYKKTAMILNRELKQRKTINNIRNLKKKTYLFLNGEPKQRNKINNIK